MAAALVLAAFLGAAIGLVWLQADTDEVDQDAPLAPDADQDRAP